MSPLRHARSIALLSVLLSCGGGDPQAPAPPPSQLTLRIVSGSAQIDSIDARLATPLVAEVKYDDGRPGVGVAVRFSAIDPTALQLLPSPAASPDSVAVVQTDASGRASVGVAYRNRIGNFGVAISAAGVSGTSSAQFTVSYGRAHALTITTRDTLLYVGRSYQPAFSVRDRAGNSLTGTLTSASNDCMIEALHVFGVNVGRCSISVSAPPLLDSLHVSVVRVASLLVIRNDFDLLGSPRLGSMGLDGTGYSELAALPYQFPFELLLPLRAPDRRRITMHTGMGDFSTHLTIFDSSTTARTFMPQGINSIHENWGRFSPDGQWLYFSARASMGEAFSVWRARPDGTQGERITPLMPNRGFHSNYADLTPDGKTIAYVDGNLNLNVIDVATRVVTPLTAAGVPLQAFQLRISPDGRRVAFIYGSPRFGMHVINVDGTGYRLVSADIGYDNDVPLDWTGDSEWILTRRHEYIDGIIFGRTWVLLNAQSGAIVPLPFKEAPTSMMFDR